MITEMLDLLNLRREVGNVIGDIDELTCNWKSVLEFAQKLNILDTEDVRYLQLQPVTRDWMEVVINRINKKVKELANAEQVAS